MRKLIENGDNVKYINGNGDEFELTIEDNLGKSPIITNLIKVK